MRRIAIAFAALLALAPPGDAQVDQDTLPPNTVIGRLGVGTGPAQAIPLSQLPANLPPLSTLTGDCTVNGSNVITCTKTGGVALAAPGSATTDATNSANDNFIASGTGAVTRSVQVKSRDWVSVKDFGATGSGSGDDGPAINSAATAAGAGGTVFFPAGNYNVQTQIASAAGVTFFGGGGQPAGSAYSGNAIITKGANIDLIALGDRETWAFLSINGNGGSFTGRVFNVTAGNDQKLLHLHVLGCQTFCLDVANNTGIRLEVDGGTWQQTTATNPAIRFANGGSLETNGDRMIHNVMCSGGWLVDTDHSQNTFVQGNDCINMTFGPDAAKTNIVGNRWATVAGNLTVTGGTQHLIADNIIDGSIVLSSGVQNTVIGRNTLASGQTVTDNSGNNTNSYGMRQVVFGNTVSLAQATTNFCNQATCGGGAASTGLISPIAGIVRNLTVTASVAPAAGQTYTITINQGGLLSVTCTISNPATTCTDTIHAAAVTANSSMFTEIVLSATSGAATFAWGFEYDSVP